jgi:hypothetical protein
MFGLGGVNAAESRREPIVPTRPELAGSSHPRREGISCSLPERAAVRMVNSSARAGHPPSVAALRHELRVEFTRGEDRLCAAWLTVRQLGRWAFDVRLCAFLEGNPLGLLMRGGALRTALCLDDINTGAGGLSNDAARRRAAAREISR